MKVIDKHPPVIDGIGHEPTSKAATPHIDYEAREVESKVNFRNDQSPRSTNPLTSLELKILGSVLRNRVFEVQLTEYGAAIRHRHELRHLIPDNFVRAIDIGPRHFTKLLHGRLELSPGVCKHLLSLVEASIEDCAAGRQGADRHVSNAVGWVLNLLGDVLDYAAEEDKTLILEPEKLTPIKHEPVIDRRADCD